MKLSVWLAIHHHEFGPDIDVYETPELAEQARQQIALDHWPDHLGIMPDDAMETANRFFAYSDENRFEITKRVVIRD